MTVNKQTLVEILDKVKPAVGAKDNNMQQDCFVFYGGHVLAFNDDVAVHCILHESMEMLDGFSVQAKEFHTLVNKLPGNELEIELLDDCLEIKAGRSRSKFKIQHEIKMPLDELCDWGDFGTELPEKFSNALSLVSPACSRDMTKPLTTCVFLSGNSIVATDNYCAARYIFDDFEWRGSCYISKTTADILSKYSLAVYSLKKDGWLQFGTVDETCVLDCRTYYKGQPFADVNPLFNEHGEKLILPSKLISSLERAGLFVKSCDTSATSSDDPFVKISVEKNRMTVIGSGSIGEYTETMRIDYEGQTREFSINASLLSRVLQEGYKCELCKRFIHIYDDHYDYLVAYSEYK